MMKHDKTDKKLTKVYSHPLCEKTSDEKVFLLNRAKDLFR